MFVQSRLVYLDFWHKLFGCILWFWSLDQKAGIMSDNVVNSYSLKTSEILAWICHCLDRAWAKWASQVSKASPKKGVWDSSKTNFIAMYECTFDRENMYRTLSLIIGNCFMLQHRVALNTHVYTYHYKINFKILSDILYLSEW